MTLIKSATLPMFALAIMMLGGCGSAAAQASGQMVRLSKLVIDASQLEAYKADRTGAIVGPELMKRYGWKIGDKITLIGTIFPFNPEVTIRGVYKHKFDSSSFFIHFDYFYEATKEVTRGTVGTFWVRVRDPKDMAGISQQIDAMFKNSEAKFSISTPITRAWRAKWL